MQDRDGAPALIVALLGETAGVKKLFADSGYAGPKLQDGLKDPGVPELPQAQGRDPKSPSLGIYGMVASLGGGPEESVFKDLRMDGSLPPSCKGCRTDSGEFSGLGATGRMSVHDAQGCPEPETTAVFGNRRLMTYGTDS